MKDIISTVAGLMALSARTAPKTVGKDFLDVKVITGEELNQLAEAIVRHGEEAGKKNWDRDANNVRQSEAVLLISLDKPQPAGLNCGACGFKNCNDLPAPRGGTEFAGPLCAWRLVDLGIAIGSAAKTAGLLNADNRVMYRVGVAARKIGFIAGEVVIGIPLSATGKSIYFDR
jgi:uncharacterized ferredoxin-like protein